MDLTDSSDIEAVYEHDLIARIHIGDEIIPYDHIRFKSEGQLWETLVGEIYLIPFDGRCELLIQQRHLRNLHLLPDFKHYIGPPSYDMTPIAETLRCEARSNIKLLDQETGRIPDIGTLRCPFSITEFIASKIIRYDWKVKPRNNPVSQDPEPFISTPQSSLLLGEGQWQRFINLTGLEYTSANIFKTVGHKALDRYRDCTPLPASVQWTIQTDPTTSKELRVLQFRLTYFRIVKDYQVNTIHNWKHGKLRNITSHRPQGRDVRGAVQPDQTMALANIGECAYTTKIWYLDCHGATVHKATYEQCDPLLYVYILLSKKLPQITREWEEIKAYFHYLFPEKDAFLDVDFHDSLLVDDEVFSRSKKYFWALTTMKRIIDGITLCMKQLSSVLELGRTSDRIERQHQVLFQVYRSKLRSVYHDWEEIVTTSQDTYREITELRAGLFNASAVMESRASRRLGENVRLLTFVSILFLPLAFCMSVWSINDKFSLQSLAITAMVIAVSTYMLVFNIDNVTEWYSRSFAGISSKVIDKMKQDADAKWQQRAMSFEKFTTPSNVERKPTDWILLQYAVKKYLFPERILRTALVQIRRICQHFRRHANDELPTTVQVPKISLTGPAESIKPSGYAEPSPLSSSLPPPPPTTSVSGPTVFANQAQASCSVPPAHQAPTAPDNSSTRRSSESFHSALYYQTQPLPRAFTDPAVKGNCAWCSVDGTTQEYGELATRRSFASHQDRTDGVAQELGQLQPRTFVDEERGPGIGGEL